MKKRTLWKTLSLMLAVMLTVALMSACGTNSCKGDTDPADSGTTENLQNGTIGGSDDASNAESNAAGTPFVPKPYEDPDLLEPI